MWFGTLIAGIVGLSTASSAFAQDWFLYESELDNFTVNLPAEPVMEHATYELPSGETTTARIYTATGGEGMYKVTVVDYAELSVEEKASAIENGADTFRNREGEVTLDEFGFFEGADSRYMQTSNPDGTRSYIVVAYLPERSNISKLFIAEGITPPGQPIAAIFQNSLGWVDSYGTRIRYQRDVEGNRYRVIPDAGGAPLRNRVP